MTYIKFTLIMISSYWLRSDYFDFFRWRIGCDDKGYPLPRDDKKKVEKYFFSFDDNCDDNCDDNFDDNCDEKGYPLPRDDKKKVE